MMPPQMVIPNPMGGTPSTPTGMGQFPLTMAPPRLGFNPNPYGLPNLPVNPFPGQEADSVSSDGRQIRVQYSQVTGCWELLRYLN